MKPKLSTSRVPSNPARAKKPEIDDPAAAVARVVDAIGDLEAELNPYKAKMTSLEANRKVLRSMCSGYPPEAPITANGARYTAILGPCSMDTTVNIPELVKEIGDLRYIEISSVSLTRLRENVGPDIMFRVVDSTQSGPRSVTVSKKGA